MTLEDRFGDESSNDSWLYESLCLVSPGSQEDKSEVPEKVPDTHPPCIPVRDVVVPPCIPARDVVMYDQRGSTTLQAEVSAGIAMRDDNTFGDSQTRSEGVEEDVEMTGGHLQTCLHRDEHVPVCPGVSNDDHTTTTPEPSSGENSDWKTGKLSNIDYSNTYT